jgi:hypothetical protein
MITVLVVTLVSAITAEPATSTNVPVREDTASSDRTAPLVFFARSWSAASLEQKSVSPVAGEGTELFVTGLKRCAFATLVMATAVAVSRRTYVVLSTTQVTVQVPA